MPGVPSATPAHEKHGVDRSVDLAEGTVDVALVAQVDLDRLCDRVADVGDVENDQVGPELAGRLRRRRPHPGRAADHEDPLAVVPERVDRHCNPLSFPRSSHGFRTL